MKKQLLIALLNALTFIIAEVVKILRNQDGKEPVVKAES